MAGSLHLADCRRPGYYCRSGHLLSAGVFAVRLDICFLFLSCYMRPEGPWQQLRCGRSGSGIAFYTCPYPVPGRRSPLISAVRLGRSCLSADLLSGCTSAVRPGCISAVRLHVYFPVGKYSHLCSRQRRARGRRGSRPQALWTARQVLWPPRSDAFKPHCESAPSPAQQHAGTRSPLAREL